MASVATVTAVSKPKVAWVQDEIVVDGLGDADDGHALLDEARGDPEGAVAADGDHARRRRPRWNRRMISSEMSMVTFLPSRSVMNSNGWPLLTVPRIVPPRWAMPRTLSRVRSTRPSCAWLEQPVVAAADAGDLPAAAQPGQRDGADDGVEARGVASAGVDQDVHVLRPYRGCHAERKGGVWKQTLGISEIAWI